jgi:hypothetical protein
LKVTKKFPDSAPKDNDDLCWMAKGPSNLLYVLNENNKWEIAGIKTADERASKKFDGVTSSVNH